MSLPNCFHLSACGQTLLPILADRLQHRESEFVFLFCCLLQQILVNEGGYFLQHRCRFIPKGSRESLNRRQTATTDEDGELSEKKLFLCSQQIIAPLDRLAQEIGRAHV